MVWQGRCPLAGSACVGWGCLRGRLCLRAGTSDRCAPPVLSLPPLRGRPRSRSHGRLRRPKSLPIRHSPAASQCSGPWARVITSVLTFWLHRFASLGLKSRIDARIAPFLTLWLHRFASLGLKSRIDAWIALVLAFWLHRFASLGLKSRIDAALSCRQVERPACVRTLPLR